MCGIAGILHDDPCGRPEEQLVSLMCDRIVHRGPDSSGVLIDGPVGLGHRRLSIIDLAGGHQPVFNEDRAVAVVFNGEIYNHKPLRRWLEKRGHTFVTSSDTEVLVHAYEEEGPRFVERLRGMFAFAIWDKNRRRLLLVRDRLGKKPLYYYHRDGRLLFGSELKCLLADSRVDLSLDYEAIYDYLSFLCIIDPKTIFKHVRKVRPGHYVIVEDGALSERSYWRLDPNAIDPRGRLGLQAALVAQLDDAVACRLESEVPLGAFLSGGVDSSAVVAMMARHSEQRVQTANIGFDVARFDESGYAETVARRYQTDHYTEKVKVDAAGPEELERLVWHLDEPFADASAIPTGRVCGIARKRVTVALSGDGGDEVFAGYPRYFIDLMEQRIRGVVPAALRKRVLGPLGELWPRHPSLPKPLRLGSTLAELARDGHRAHFHSVSYFREPAKAGFFTGDFLQGIGDYSSFSVLEEHYREVETKDPLAGMLYVDIKTYLPARMLMKVDKMAMMHSLEVRSPFLDHHLVEFGLRVPARYKVRGRECKWLLKKAMEPYLPDDVLYRPKQGFDVPLADWLRGNLAEPLLEAILALGKRGYLAQGPMKKLYDEHQSGAADHANLLWILYMLEMWHQVFRVSP